MSSIQLFAIGLFTFFAAHILASSVPSWAENMEVLAEYQKSTSEQPPYNDSVIAPDKFLVNVYDSVDSVEKLPISKKSLIKQRGDSGLIRRFKIQVYSRATDDPYNGHISRRPHLQVSLTGPIIRFIEDNDKISRGSLPRHKLENFLIQAADKFSFIFDDCNLLIRTAADRGVHQLYRYTDEDSSDDLLKAYKSLRLGFLKKVKRLVIDFRENRILEEVRKAVEGLCCDKIFFYIRQDITKVEAETILQIVKNAQTHDICFIFDTDVDTEKFFGCLKEIDWHDINPLELYVYPEKHNAVLAENVQELISFVQTSQATLFDCSWSSMNSACVGKLLQGIECSNVRELCIAGNFYDMECAAKIERLLKLEKLIFLNITGEPAEVVIRVWQQWLKKCWIDGLSALPDEQDSVIFSGLKDTERQRLNAILRRAKSIEAIAIPWVAGKRRKSPISSLQKELILTLCVYLGFVKAYA